MASKRREYTYPMVVGIESMRVLVCSRALVEEGVSQSEKDD